MFLTSTTLIFEDVRSLLYKHKHKDVWILGYVSPYTLHPFDVYTGEHTRPALTHLATVSHVDDNVSFLIEQPLPNGSQIGCIVSVTSIRFDNRQGNGLAWSKHYLPAFIHLHQAWGDTGGLIEQVEEIWTEDQCQNNTAPCWMCATLNSLYVKFITYHF